MKNGLWALMALLLMPSAAVRRQSVVNHQVLGTSVKPTLRVASHAPFTSKRHVFRRFFTTQILLVLSCEMAVFGRATEV